MIQNTQNLSPYFGDVFLHLCHPSWGPLTAELQKAIIEMIPGKR